ncbi:uncharacterized protein Hap1MRO34_012736 isoform 1-T1 [Clarias gariepinus]|uniref:uncharacterized protein LOC128531990 isoform X1 n=2 Tax=Clarias gariepinus TaxID=13013 RepID=UPI00234D410E|nr:uncharacterized protein LOC128531990 isoform X1 [Clarias gariepinus]
MKISHELSLKIRSLWRTGHHFSDIKTFLSQSGIHVSDDTVRRHCRSRRLTPPIKAPTVSKVTSSVLQCLDEMLHEDVKRTAKQIQKELQNRLQLKISISTVRRSIKKLRKSRGGVKDKRQTAEELRPELLKRSVEIQRLKQQLRVCKVAHVKEMDALKCELHVCKEATAVAKAAFVDLQATHKGFIETHSAVMTQLREVQTVVTGALLNCAHTLTSDCSSPTRCTASGDAERTEIMSSPTTSITSCHPELQFIPPTTELLESLMIQSQGRPDRLGCLLFRTVVPQAVYKEWTSTTNWDGSKRKLGLPPNLKNFLMETVAQKFPFLTSGDIRRIKDRVNEFLRSPRSTVTHRCLQD